MSNYLCRFALATLALALASELIKHIEARPMPQMENIQEGIQMGMLVAAGTVKEMIDAGGAAHHEQSVEVLGAKMGHAMEMGFGDAMGRRRRRRRAVNSQNGSNAVSSAESYESESDSSSLSSDSDDEDD